MISEEKLYGIIKTQADTIDLILARLIKCEQAVVLLQERLSTLISLTSELTDKLNNHIQDYNERERKNNGRS